MNGSGRDDVIRSGYHCVHMLYSASRNPAYKANGFVQLKLATLSMMALRPSIITVIGLIITMATHPLGLTSGRHSTKLEVFVDKTVRGRAPTERGNTRSGATKNARFHAPFYP